MARLAANSAFNNISGQLGKQIVLKQYKDKTVVTRYPNMTRVKPSPLQKQKRTLFKDAVAYAQNINRNAVLKNKYLKKIKPGGSVYHFALKEYLSQHS